MKKPNLVFFAAFLFCGSVYLFNAAWLAPERSQSRQVLAHRGLHQTFDPIGVTNTSCTASRIDSPRHNYIENTLPAFRAAMDMGAGIIEFDVHPTIDGKFMVFHDWGLACRTNEAGITREKSSAYLKTLDIGHGYTADNGKTYPFRGHFIGAMPSLGEILTAFPDMQFLINIKSKSAVEGSLLTSYINNHPSPNRSRLSVYGNGRGVEAFRALNPDLKTLTKAKAKACLKSYILTGWSGYVSKACHNTYVPVPENFQRAIWGWPARFEARMERAGSTAILMGPYTKARAGRAIDSRRAIANIPKGFGGIIWTNRIDLFAAATPERPSDNAQHR